MKYTSTFIGVWKHEAGNAVQITTKNCPIFERSRDDAHMRELQQGILGMNISLKLVHNWDLTMSQTNFYRLAFQI